MEAGAMYAADDFSTICIAVLIAGYICTFLFASFFEKGIGPIPQLFRDNGWDIRVWIHNPFTFPQKGFLLGTIVQRLGFVTTVPSLVFGIGQYVFDGQLIKLIS